MVLEVADRYSGTFIEVNNRSGSQDSPEIEILQFPSNDSTDKGRQEGNREGVKNLLPYERATWFVLQKENMHRKKLRSSSPKSTSKTQDDGVTLEVADHRTGTFIEVNSRSECHERQEVEILQYPGKDDIDYPKQFGRIKSLSPYVISENEVKSMSPYVMARSSPSSKKKSRKKKSQTSKKTSLK